MISPASRQNVDFDGDTGRRGEAVAPTLVLVSRGILAAGFSSAGGYQLLGLAIGLSKFRSELKGQQDREPATSRGTYHLGIA
jgi:hypothetical protein